MATDVLDDARDQAIEHLKRRRKFYVDALTYVTVNVVLWLIWALTDRSGGGIPWPVWASAIWGAFLARDAVKAFGPWAQRIHAPISEAEIQREIERFGHKA